MNAVTPINPVTMRTPFPDHQISKLPKETKAQREAREKDRNLMVWKCDLCGGAHHKNAVHLDYVGHAALTDRLLDVDPEWSWEPVAFGPDGLPAIDRNGGLWIRLTILGMTRMGYGDADGKTGGNAVKEAIGDALRNAAMRFGAALDLWHKGDLHLDADGEDAGGQSNVSAVSPPQTAFITPADLTKVIQLCEAVGGNQSGALCKAYEINRLDDLPAKAVVKVIERLNEKLAEKAKAASNEKAEAA